MYSEYAESHGTRNTNRSGGCSSRYSLTVVIQSAPGNDMGLARLFNIEDK
jgi:hypothetical protein